MSNYFVAAGTKIVFIGLLLAIYSTKLPFMSNSIQYEMQNVILAAQWFLAMSIYPVLTQSTLQFIWDVFLFLVTFKLFLWIFMPGSHDSDQHNQSASGQSPAAKMGFTSRNIYS